MRQEQLRQKARNVQNGNNRRRTPRTTLSMPVDGGPSTSNVSVQPPSAPGPSTLSPSTSVTPSTTVAPASSEGSSECPFCYELYCNDGQDWLQCGCGAWVHENCIEDIIHDSDGKEKFCPICLNSF